jgi:hypothetical protein
MSNVMLEIELEQTLPDYLDVCHTGLDVNELQMFLHVILNLFIKLFVLLYIS